MFISRFVAATSASDGTALTFKINTIHSCMENVLWTRTTMFYWFMSVSTPGVLLCLLDLFYLCTSVWAYSPFSLFWNRMHARKRSDLIGCNDALWEWRFFFMRLSAWLLQHQYFGAALAAPSSPRAHHSWIRARKSWFGKSCLFGSWAPVFGDRSLPFANHCSMLVRSYVNPSAAMTGSCSSSSVKYCCDAWMLHGYFDLPKSARSTANCCLPCSPDLSYRRESCHFLAQPDCVALLLFLIPSFLLWWAIGYMQMQTDSNLHLFLRPELFC